MKKRIIFLAILLIVLVGILIFLRGNEDSWIKDSRGVWIKHGNPSVIPDYVFEQQGIINCALGKFEGFNKSKNSQCLGICMNYAVDLVNVPRNSDDDLKENQCEDFISGTVTKFIELDREGNVVRII